MRDQGHTPKNRMDTRIKERNLAMNAGKSPLPVGLGRPHDVRFGIARHLHCQPCLGREL